MSEHLDAANAGGLVGGVRRYRKLPVVIEAILFEGSKNDAQVAEFVGEQGSRVEFATSDPVDTRPSWVIHTAEGDMRAEVGDYIIRGVAGEFYPPCKPDIFKATYEPA